MNKSKPEWRVIIEILEKVDIELLNRIVRRMIYYLHTSNVKAISELMQELNPLSRQPEEDLYTNVPNPTIDHDTLRKFAEKVFQIAEENIFDEQISVQINLWLAQERSRFLSIAVEKQHIPLQEICEVIKKFMTIPRGESFLSPDEFVNIRVGLIRRFLSTNLKYINSAKHYIKVIDFDHIIDRIIGPGNGTGKLGGKSAGLILAHSILEYSKEDYPELSDIKIPDSWFISSDAIMDFIHYNAMEETTSIRYLDTEEVRAGYTYLQQIFKNAYFPPAFLSQLEQMLQNIGNKPIIVRSSSLLEDSFEGAFSGKYKSLFLSNTGTYQERLSALTDAIAEVYASIFGPDPIAYRKERGLIDFQEQMGILVQEVVGNRVGKYFFPTYAGVAFSHNEFRWSPRITREDGVVRLVAGLGTRAVDRVGNDYSFLASPGKPGLKINITYQDIIKYSQQNIDVLNLETCEFETISIDKILEEYGSNVPGIEKVVSIDRYGSLAPPVGFIMSDSGKDMVVTFQNLTENSSFLKKIQSTLKALEKAYGAPVDLEFASDGKDLYILQCRPQSTAKNTESFEIPSNIDEKLQLFDANKYITSGFLPEVKHLVFVKPEVYDNLPSVESMKRVASVVSALNKSLEKKKFILIGPGRWGSRGDIKLGVQVTYSDINNTGMLIELAYNKNGYVPELSFGTHFFQDLVEADIKYLPVYPDEENNSFNRELIDSLPNSLSKVLPEFSDMEEVIHLISIDDIEDGNNFSVVMDSDEERAVGYFTS